MLVLVKSKEENLVQINEGLFRDLTILLQGMSEAINKYGCKEDVASVVLIYNNVQNTAHYIVGTESDNIDVNNPYFVSGLVPHGMNDSEILLLASKMVSKLSDKMENKNNDL